MPPRNVTSSDSETERRTTKEHSSKKLATPSKHAPLEDKEEVEDESGEDEEEEYEIEAILESKRGAFPEGRIGYLVKWKGYDESHNSWVDEKDAGNATDLIEAFNARRNKKYGRKSLPKVTQSPAARDEPKSEGRKKRGRPSNAIEKESDEQVDSEEETKNRWAKRVKKAPTTTTTTNRSVSKKRATVSSEPDELLIDGLVSMEKWMNLESWDDLVETVDTIERENGKDLSVYFTLTTGERTRQPSDLCAQKFPLKMIRFYEAHLRWLAAGEPPSK